MDETEGTHSQRATGSDPESLSPTQLLKRQRSMSIWTVLFSADRKDHQVKIYGL